MKTETIKNFEKLFAELPKAERLAVRAMLEKTEQQSVEVRDDANEQMQTRMLIKGIETRDADAKARPDSIGTVVGYAAKFNSPSKDFGGFREVIKPGAFTRSLKETGDDYDVRALLGHDKSAVLARRSAGTLEISEDEVGLKVQLHLIDTTAGRDTYKNIKARNLDAMSFGFIPKKTNWTRANDGMVRELQDVTLAEVSVVSWAQYGNTEISARERGEIFVPSAVETVSIAMLRRRHNLMILEARGYGDVSTDYPTPRYGSTNDQATQASYTAAQATRNARDGNKEDHETAMKAHQKAAKLHADASKTAPAHHESLADEHKALAKMHSGKC